MGTIYKFIRINVLAIVLFIFLNASFALCSETGKLCPDPSLKYISWSGERYWKDAIDSHLSEIVKTDEFVCAKYSEQLTHNVRSSYVIVSMKSIENRKSKEKGLLIGIADIFGAFNNAGKEFKKYKSVWDQVMKKFSKDYVPIMEKFTDLKFTNNEEWFEWWETNKDRLVLSQDGKYLVVKKNN